MTEVIEVLRADHSLHIVMFAPTEKAEYYRRKFSSDRLIVEEIPLIKESKLSQIVTLAAKNLYDNRTIYWRQRKRLFSDNNKTIFRLSRIISKIGHLPLIKLFTREFFSLIADKEHFSPFFEKYEPDAVFLPDIYALDDVCLGLAAQARGVKCIGMVRSWDNVSGKGVCLIRPDKIVVNNEILKSEVERLLAYPGSDIEVVGVPQFDYYVGYKPTPRAGFFKKMGLEETDEYILFVPYFGPYLEAANEILSNLDKAIEKGSLPEDLKIIVRMPPSFYPGKTEVYESRRIIIDYPGTKFGKDEKADWEFSEADIIHFADSLYYAKVVISAASTITIDAAALDRPAINVMFDGDGEKEFAKSFARASENDHFKAVLDSGGAALSRSYDELIGQVNDYIQDPKKDEEGRARLVRGQCSKLDGQSGKKLGEFILSQLR